MNRLIILLSFVFLFSCKEDPEILQPEPPVYGIVANNPGSWPQPLYQYENNPLSDAAFRLGRRLFYDTKLSRDNSTSCGSCHQQFVAFAHSNHNVSHGIDGLLGTRNTPGLFNLRWHPTFMWDGGVNHIEVQPAAPITNPVEMDESLENLVVKIGNLPEYKYYFKEAYGDETVNTQRIFLALAQFMGMLDSWNSRFDRYQRGEAGANLSEQEKAGYSLFKTHCNSCHTEPLFSDFSYRGNGLLPDNAIPDSGRAQITGLAADRFKFKVPSLRNVAVTKPYMHDGRYTTLYRCVDHYTTLNASKPGIDPQLANGIALNEEEKLQIIAFLQTLTDSTFIKDPRFADPFR